jgi:hypothetical protein
MAIIRNGQVVTATPWYYAFSPLKLIELVMLFFQTLTSPESVSEIRARNAAKRNGTQAPKPLGRPQTGNVRTVNMRDCGAGG